jgi:hypothetical protein
LAEAVEAKVTAEDSMIMELAHFQTYYYAELNERDRIHQEHILASEEARRLAEAARALAEEKARQAQSLAEQTQASLLDAQETLKRIRLAMASMIHAGMNVFLASSPSELTAAIPVSPHVCIMRECPICGTVAP